MMTFVEHREAEAGAEVLHVKKGGVVGRDGDRLHEMVAAAEDADLQPKALAQQPVPLRDQIEGVGATTMVSRRTASMASNAASVLPAPVGRTTTPRPCAARQASTASV